MGRVKPELRARAPLDPKPALELELQRPELPKPELRTLRNLRRVNPKNPRRPKPEKRQRQKQRPKPKLRVRISLPPQLLRLLLTSPLYPPLLLPLLILEIRPHQRRKRNRVVVA